MKVLGPRLVYDAILEKAGIERKGSADADGELMPLPSTAFRLRLENHLGDVRRGESWRSRTVNRELLDRHHQNTKSLAKFDHGSLQRYMGLLSAMPYAQQARLAATMNDVSVTLENLQRAPEMAQKMVDDLKAIFEPESD